MASQVKGRRAARAIWGRSQCKPLAFANASANANDYSPAPDSRSPSFTATARDDTWSFASAPRSRSHPPRRSKRVHSTYVPKLTSRRLVNHRWNGSAGCSSRVFVCPFVYKPNTPAEHPAARSRAKFGSAPGPSKGVPAPTLRCDPGTPFLDQQTSIDVQVKGQVQSDEWKRAGSDEQGGGTTEDWSDQEEELGGERKNGWTAAAAATTAGGHGDYGRYLGGGWRGRGRSVVRMAAGGLSGRWLAATWTLRGANGGWRTAGVVEGAGGAARLRLGEHEDPPAPAADTDSLANSAPAGSLQQLIELARLEP